MLAIRMQRTGRKGHAMFRMVVQDARLTPTSGKIVAQLGSYNPHTKAVVLDKTQAEAFLKNGAQPSERMAMLLKKEGVKLPKWVTPATKKSGKARNPEKLRANQPAAAAPAEPAAEVAEAVEEPVASAEPAAAPEATEAEAPAVEEVAAEVPAEVPAEAPTAEAEPAEKPEA